MKTIRTRAIIAFVGMLACWLFPSAVWASVQVNGIYYDLNTSAKTAAVASNPDYYSGAINIPASFVYNGNTYKVTSIGSTAFLDCTAMTEVIMPSSVTSIAASAFERCTGLTTLYIGKGVTTINYEAFKNCSNLTSLILPASVKTIGNETFSGCTSLAEIIVERTTAPTISSTTFNGVDKTSCTVYVPEGYRSSYINASYWKNFSNIVERTVVATKSCGDNVIYTVYSDETMVISGTGAMWDMDPLFGYLYYNSSSIYLYDNSSSIKKVVIEEGVTTIGELAFRGFGQMTSVSIPNTVISIRDRAFLGCSSLVSISIPTSVTTIGAAAFEGCSSLTSLFIPYSVSQINTNNELHLEDDYIYGVFGFCEELNSISVDTRNPKYDSRNNCNAIIETSTNKVIAGCKSTVIPNGVSSIGELAFFGCSIASVIIPNGVTSIDDKAFYKCSELTTVSVPNSVTHIGEEAFSETAWLDNQPDGLVYAGKHAYLFKGEMPQGTEITIEEGTLTVADGAFSHTGLASVTIPNSVTSIGCEAFSMCENLTSVTIPNSVTRIDGNAFEGCTGMTSIFVASGNSKYDSRDNCNAIIETSTNTLIAGCKNTIIPNSVIHIGDFAFNRCTSLTSVTIPNSVTCIGNEAFYYCTGLTSVIIPNSVTTIGEAAFEWCTSLYSITVEAETPPSVGLWAFIQVNKSNCTLYVPFGYKSAYQNAEGWSEFENIEESPVLVGNLYYQLDISDRTAIVDRIADKNYSGAISIPKSVNYGGETYTVTEISGNAFIDCTGLISVEIPNGVTRIDGFSGCSGLTSIEIPNSVTHIEGAAFYGCTGLISVVLPNSLPYIDICTFDDCTSLTSIDIPNSVTVIGMCAFRHTGLTSVTIPNSVTYIDEGAFFNCTSLASIEIPYSVTGIESEVFGRCTGLASISVDSNNTKYDSRDNCNAIIETASNKLIAGCKNTIIPRSVTSIGYSAFYGCTGLISVVIPRSVISIDYSAFEDCTGLTSITVEHETPIDYDDAFENVDKSNCILYVPLGSKTAYENAEGWSEFENIVEFELDTDISALDNAIYVDQVNGLVGGTMNIPVKMKNDFDVRGFQFTMELPEGTTINSWQVNPDRLPSGISASKVLPMERIEGNRIVATCVLNDGNKTFTGYDGEIATVNVTFGSDMAAGTYPIYLTEASISDASSTNQKVLSDIKATLVLDDYVVGDTNGDGKVLIGDVISILNYIVGERPEGFNEKAADVNSDGKILVGDVIAVLNIIVGL